MDRWPPSLDGLFGGDAVGPLLHLLEENDVKHIRALQRRSFLCGRDFFALWVYQPDLLRNIRRVIYRKCLEIFPQSPRAILTSPYFILWTNSDVKQWVINIARELGLSLKFAVSRNACVALHGPFFLDKEFKIGLLTNGLVVSNGTNLSRKDRRRIAKLALEIRIEMNRGMIWESLRQQDVEVASNEMQDAEVANDEMQDAEVANDEMQEVVLDLDNTGNGLESIQQHLRLADQTLSTLLVKYRARCLKQIEEMERDLQSFDSLSDDELGISDVLQTSDYAETMQSSQTDGLAQRQSHYACPPYWRDFTGSLDKYGDQSRLTTVRPEIFETISSLMEACWKEDETVVGRDSRGLNQRRFRILQIQQIENPSVFSLYRTKCRNLEAAASSVIFDARVQTKGKSAVLDQRLMSGVNECYLWHGTKEGTVRTICEQGFDPRVSGDGLFGSGTYFAEKSSKSNQYAGLSILQPKHNVHNFSENVCFICL